MLFQEKGGNTLAANFEILFENTVFSRGGFSFQNSQTLNIRAKGRLE